MFDWGMFWTIIGSALAVIGFIYQFLRNVKSDIREKLKDSDDKFALLDNRIFELAMGKSLKEILQAERRK